MSTPDVAMSDAPAFGQDPSQPPAFGQAPFQTPPVFGQPPSNQTRRIVVDGSYVGDIHQRTVSISLNDLPGHHRISTPSSRKVCIDGFIVEQEAFYKIEIRGYDDLGISIINQCLILETHHITVNRGTYYTNGDLNVQLHST